MFRISILIKSSRTFNIVLKNKVTGCQAPCDLCHVSPHFLYAMQLVTPIVVAIAVSMLISN